MRVRGQGEGMGEGEGEVEDGEGARGEARGVKARATVKTLTDGGDHSADSTAMTVLPCGPAHINSGKGIE